MRDGNDSFIQYIINILMIKARGYMAVIADTPRSVSEVLGHLLFNEGMLIAFIDMICIGDAGGYPDTQGKFLVDIVVLAAECNQGGRRIISIDIDERHFSLIFWFEREHVPHKLKPRQAGGTTEENVDSRCEDTRSCHYHRQFRCQDSRVLILHACAYHKIFISFRSNQANIAPPDILKTTRPIYMNYKS